MGGLPGTPPNVMSVTSGVLGVRQVTERIKLLLEKQFPYIWVQGEVTNLTRPESGHVYFSLRENDALLACVWFRGRQRMQEKVDPLTGEVLDDESPRPTPFAALRNGQNLICSGQISVYPPRGGYQLVVDMVQDRGEGLLYQAMEELRRRLFLEGLFDLERKRPLPSGPSRVALITSPGGAAVRDFIRIAADRGAGARIRLYPALVQGDEAPAQIVRALQLADRDVWPDGARAQIIVLVRGGGSLQDLWAFNDADLARAIFAADTPVLTGIGHEIDTSIADLVADVRAATPSHAAQLLWPERQWYAQRLDDLQAGMARAFTRRLRHEAHCLSGLEQGLAWLSPARQVRRLEERNGVLTERLARAGLERLRRAGEKLGRAEERLRGSVPFFAHAAQTRLEQTQWRLHAAGKNCLERAAKAAASLDSRLALLDPLAPLERGYALVYDAHGRCIRSVRDARPGDRAEIVIPDGALSARIEQVRPKNDAGLDGVDD